MAVNKNNYHITLKNLRTGVVHGFMLAGGDTPYMVQGVDNIAQKIQDGEILYSDFTNSRVFAQEEWSEGTSKFWDPEKSGFYIFPSKKYKDKKNINIIGSEFQIGHKLSEVFTFSQGKGVICRGGGSDVYVADGMKIYKSTDYGQTYSLFKDLDTEKYLTGIVNEIIDMKLIITNPKTMNHTGELATVNIGSIKQLWVCLYNRGTQHTEVARCDLNDTIKAYSGSTFKKTYSGTISVAYSSRRTNLEIDTTIPTAPISGTLRQYNYGGSTKTFFFVNTGTCASNKLFPGQRFKATRASTGIVYNCTVMGWGGWYGGGGISNNEMGISGIPSYSGGSPSDNDYTITDIGYTGSICFPITSGGIENTVAIGLGLGQTFSYNNEKYVIDGISNGNTNIGNGLPNYTDAFQPGSSIVNTDYVLISKVGGGDVKPGLMNKGLQNFTLDTWITSFGNYLNNITKFVNISNTDTEHLWGVNHIDPHNKLYDVAYGEITTVLTNSMIYCASWAGGIGSPQNHTYTFDNGMCPISGIEYPYGEVFGIMWIGTQNSSNGGTEAKIIRLSLNDTQTKPTFLIKATIGVEGITGMTYNQGYTYLATKKEGEIYEYFNENAKITKLAQLALNSNGESIIDNITIFGGNVVVSNPSIGGVSVLDLTTRQNASPLIEVDPLCSIIGLENKRIYNITNTGGSLLFSCEEKIYNYDKNNFADEGYLESSIYGGYISNVDKLWVYAYIRVNKWTIDEGQKVALQASFDQGKTWNFVPTSKNKSFGSVLDWNDADYIHSFATGNEQLTFIFPYNTKSGTILYRCWLKRGTGAGPIVNHIGVHFNLNYRQELIFNYQIDLNKSYELLNAREIEKDLHNDKLVFLKDIWQNQDMVELIDVTGKKYTCIPFSDERTPGQGLIISTSNANGSVKDLDNLVYKVSFGLKTIANYEKVL